MQVWLRDFTVESRQLLLNSTATQHLSLMKMAASFLPKLPPSSTHQPSSILPPDSSSFSPAAFRFPLRNPECHSFFLFFLHLFFFLLSVSSSTTNMYYLDFYFCQFFFLVSFFMLNLNLLRNKNRNTQTHEKKG